MANSALIDDLQKQFAANPRRVFARLANEYRKRGEFASAIEICRSQVPLQPTYVSGHIVLGQALYDSGQLEESRTTFEAALALDPENLIALRHLGDISRDGGDTAGAHSYYHRLLEIDPQNDEVAAQLDALVQPSADDSTVAAEADVEPVNWGDINPEQIQLSGADSAPADSALVDTIELPLPAAAIDMLDDAIAPAQPAAGVVGVELLGVEELAGDLSQSSAPAEVREIEDAGDTVAEFVDPEELMPAGVESVELDGLLSDLAAAAPDADDESAVVDGAANGPLVQAETGVSGVASGATVPLSAEEPYAGAPNGDAAPSAFATETMAELYLQQGFQERALAIYRDLAAQSPDDASLRNRVAELEQSAAVETASDAGSARAGRSAREFFGVLAYRRAPSGASHHFMGVGSEVPAEDENAAEALAGAFAQDPHPSDAPVGDDLIDGPSADVGLELTGLAPDKQLDNQSDNQASNQVSEQSLETSAPVEEDRSEATAGWSAGLTGHPARAASDALSLDDVFRDDSARTQLRRDESNVSFDEFFSRSDHDSVPEMTEREKAGGGAVEAESEGEGDGDPAEDSSHDLELFHAWLDGLKK